MHTDAHIRIQTHARMQGRRPGNKEFMWAGRLELQSSLHFIAHLVF